jgi:hypothetical protein
MKMKTLALFCCFAYTLAGQTLVDFDRQVHPILAAKCHACHSQEKRSGGLSLSTLRDAIEGGRSGATVKPGNGAGSLLVQRLTGEATPRMPMGGAALSENEITVVKTWIDQGARATPTSAAARPKWEAPLMLTRPELPQVVWKGWDQPVDRFVSAYLAERNIPEPTLVSDAVYARRVYLDIGGLLPTPEELRALTPETRAGLPARLLADNRRYAENWISFWDDLLRNDEGVNYYSETASRKSITPWLLSALETNLPYDQFVAKLLNPEAKSDPDGFLIGVNWRGVVNASQTPAMQAAQNTAQIFLGINLKCNSCHDSFISKWKLKDAYALAGYFSADAKLQLFRCDVAQDQYAEPAFLYPELNHIPASSALKDRQAAAAAIFLDPRNGRLPRTLVNRIWARMMGRGLVENPDEMDGEPWSPQLLDWLASDFVSHGYDLKHLIETIASSKAYQMPAVPHGDGFRGPEVRRITAEQFSDAIAALTGDWHVYQPPGAGKPGVYSREWHLAANPLTRALGRPIRDQVYSERDTQATTLQALELVNGQTLTHWLSRGAKRLMGELPPEPKALLDKPYIVKEGPIRFDIDVTGVKKIWLVLRDMGTYSPEKVEAVWKIPSLAELKPLDDAGIRMPGGNAIRVKTPSVVAYDIEGKGLTRLSGSIALENDEITSEINPQLRFFVFGEEPNLERLTPVGPETPLPAPPVFKSMSEVVDRVFWYGLGRAPSPEERRIAEGANGADAVADLLWAVLMKPEFQFIY